MTDQERSDADVLQYRVIDGANDSLDAGRDVFISAPTGSGKSRMFSVIAADQLEFHDGQKGLILSHRINLVDQGAEAMAEWVKRPVATSLCKDGHLDESGQVVYSTVQTAHERRDELQAYKFVIVDEAHHATTDNHEYAETLAALRARNPNIRTIGASATPPIGYEGLDPAMKAADKHVITFEEAIHAKLVRLPETRTPTMHYVDHRRIEDVVERRRRSAASAEFETGVRKEIASMRGPDWAYQAVQQYEKHLEGRRTLGFFDSIDEANAFVAEASGRHAVAAIHSRQRPEINEQLKADFKAGRLAMLVSVNMISEGYDIDCDGILLDKKTTSNTEYKQIVGRESRGRGRDHDERAILVDLGASTLMHGDIVIQAQAQTMRGEIENRRNVWEDLLPDAPNKTFDPWVKMTVPGTDREVYGTCLDGKVVYAARTPNGYAAFESTADKRGGRFGFLPIEGQHKGRPTAQAFGEWLMDVIPKNQHKLASMMSKRRDVSKLASEIDRDWRNREKSVASMLETIQQFAPSMQSIVGQTARQMA